MILLIAIVAGLAAGIARAWLGKRSFAVPNLCKEWLVLVAFAPQFFVFYLPATRAVISDQWVAVSLVSSQTILLIFAGLNFKQPGFFLLGLGLTFNLVVIVFNGGLMPISPETVEKLMAGSAANNWRVGARFGTSKDIILPVEETRLWALSDRFLLSYPYRVAYSLGDVIIALGAFWYLWTLGGKTDGKVDVQRTLN